MTKVAALQFSSRQIVQMSEVQNSQVSMQIQTECQVLKTCQ